jgi:DNA-binding protein Fis
MDQPKTTTTAAVVTRRRVPVDRIAKVLRAALALPARAPGEDLHALGREAPHPIVCIDAGAWLAWTLAGLRVFSLPGQPAQAEGEDTEGPEARLAAALAAVVGLAAVGGLRELDGAELSEPRGPWVPAMGLALGEAERVVLALAMLRHDGNITRVARMLGTSRRTVRESLKAAGLYPWRRDMAERSDHHHHEHHEGGAHVI